MYLANSDRSTSICWNLDIDFKYMPLSTANIYVIMLICRAKVIYLRPLLRNCFQLRFGKVNKYISNTNVFEHSGKFYSIAENHMPQEIDILTLKTLGNWDVCGAWNRPFTSHPKVNSSNAFNIFLSILLKILLVVI